jgi:ABC-type uncharacterized transport system permease subunit
VGLSNGQALVFRHTYKVSYPEGKKTITPAVEYPYGEAPIAVNEAGGALEHVSLNANDSTLMLVGSTGSQLNVLSLTSEENMMTGEVTNEQKRIDLPQMNEPVKNIFVDPRQQWLYVINGRAQADVFSLRDKSLNGRQTVEDGEAQVTAGTQLVGGISPDHRRPKGVLPSGSRSRPRCATPETDPHLPDGHHTYRRNHAEELRASLAPMSAQRRSEKPRPRTRWWPVAKAKAFSVCRRAPTA